MIRPFSLSALRLVAVAYLVFGTFSSILAQETATSPTIKPNPLFGDNTVLQRDKPVPVWGNATPGDEITITFRKQTVSTKTDDKGKWTAELKPEPAGGPDVLTIAGKDGAVKLPNVLVGEVWLFSGQSNMAFLLGRLSGENAPASITADPSFRIFNVAQNPQDAPTTALRGRWSEVNPETAKGMSAVAYFFGEQLRAKLNVPVGIIVSAVGGTSASCWTSAEGFEKAPAAKEAFFKTWEEAMAKYPEAKVKWDADMAAYNERKAKWTAEQGAAAAAPTPAAASTPKEAGGKALELIEAGAENAVAKATPAKVFPEQAPRGPLSPTSQKRPLCLFNGMINPLVPYAIRGFAWYQGESDASQARAPYYEELLRAMILDWRTRWDEKALPFLIVQLPGYAQGDDDWVTVQLAQQKIGTESGNGVIVTVDAGEEKDVHPHKKQIVGTRLANLALADVYGIKAPAHPPKATAVAKKGNEVRVTFAADEGTTLTTVPAGAPLGFELAGADGVFVPAQAAMDGAVVVLTSTVAEPKSVRYAYASWPKLGIFDSNLYPAGPFVLSIP